MNEMQKQLDQYYEREGIAHVDSGSCYEERFEKFGCSKKQDCRDACRCWKKDAVFSPPIEGVCISQYYTDAKYCGDRIPRIVVLSLSYPEPYKPEEEVEDSEGHLNIHWRETLAMVRSILHPFIAPEKFPKPVNCWKDDDIEIIQNLFVHTRTAKCCSNAAGHRPEPPEVYENCGGYLSEEMKILKPDVIITQGNDAHFRAKEHVFTDVEQVMGIEGIDPKHTIAYIANLKRGGAVNAEDDNRVYWLQPYHPGYYKGYYQHAGPKIDCESDVSGAKRKNFVRYGEEIKNFMDNPKTYCTNKVHDKTC